MALHMFPYSNGEAGFPTDAGAITSDQAKTSPIYATAIPGNSSRLIIVEQFPFFRDCLSSILRNELTIKVVTSANFSELTEVQTKDTPGIILLSTCSLTESEADTELQLLTNYCPDWRVVVLAKGDQMSRALAALKMGAKGYVSAGTEFRIIIEVIRFVAAGGTYFPARYLLEAERTPAAPSRVAPSRSCRFSSRERSVIQAIQQGKPNKIIAYELNLCVSTVKVHVRRVMKKLNVSNRTELAVLDLQLDEHQRGAVANCVEIGGAASERVDGSRSGCEVNGLIGWLLGKAFPAVDFAHCDLA